MKEMTENNLNKHLDIAIANIEAAKELLKQRYEAEKEELDKEEPKKVTLTINIKQNFDEGTEFSNEELEQLKKDLEEIMNDFTRE